MSYSLDIYYKKLKPTKDFISFATFVSFFPQLVAGPIIRASDFLPQIRQKISNLSNNSKLQIFSIEKRNLKFGTFPSLI